MSDSDIRARGRVPKNAGWHPATRPAMACTGDSMARPPGGIPARFGFRFSDLVLIRRALRFLAAKRAASIEGTRPPHPARYFVESPVVPGQELLWDIVQRNPDGSVVVEEVKSAPLEVSDRVTLWRRIRRTAVSNRGARILPRLTTNASNPTAHPEFWRELPARAAADASAVEDPARLTSADALAREALFYLTAEPGADSLGLEEARAILSAFSFEEDDEDQVLADVEGLVAALSGGLAARELCNALRGELDRRASSSDAALREFTAADLYASSDILPRLAEVPARSAQVWQRLRDIGRAAAAPQVAGGLAYQPWARVQPEVGASVSARPARLALVGRGGLGKTTILEHLRAEAEGTTVALWITGHDLRAIPAADLASALELGAFASERAGHALLVLIDGLEAAADTPNELRSVLSALGRAPESLRIVVSARDAQWRACLGTSDSMPRWTHVCLSDWRADRVRELVQASHRPTIGAELIQLLSTPLLLDLFLRTFGTAAEVPSGLASRHGVLEAYWRKRVLPDGLPVSVDRRALLMQAAEEEAHGVRFHAIAGQHALELASEGVFVSERGRYSFRHPLLRDFALGEWALDRPDDAVSSLLTIQSGLVRWGAIRAVFEATAHSQSHVQSRAILEHAARNEQLLMQFAEVLGEAQTAPGEGLTEALRLISADLARRFLGRLLSTAKLVSNSSWLNWLATRPNQREWATSASELPDEFVDVAADLLEVCVRAGADHQVSQAVAQRLRTWSTADRFRAHLLEFGGFLFHRLMRLVCSLDPSSDSLNWLAEHASAGWRCRWGALEGIAELVRRAPERSLLDRARVADVFVAGASLRRTDVGLRRDPDAPTWAVLDHVRTEVTLLGNKDANRALLDIWPEVFLPVAIDMISGLGCDEHDDRADLRTALAAAYTAPEEEPPRTSGEILASRLAAEYSIPLTEEEALGEYVDDILSERLDLRGDERDALLLAIRERARTSLSGDGAYVLALLLPAITAGHSLHAALILAKAAAEATRDVPVPIAAQILRNRALFHSFRALHPLHALINSTWSRLPGETRDEVLANIESMARSPFLRGTHAVGLVLSAIPKEERPKNLARFIDVYVLDGRDPTPRESYLGREGPQWVQEEPQSPPPTDPWSRLQRAHSRFLRGPSDEAFREANRLLKEAIASPPPHAPTADLLIAVQSVSRWTDERIRGRSADPSCALSVREQRSLAEWALSVAAREPADSLPTDADPVDVKSLPDRLYSAWSLAIELASSLLARETLTDDLGLQAELHAQVERGLNPITPLFAFFVFSHLPLAYWVQSGSPGRNVFRTLVEEAGVKDPGALIGALRPLACLPLVEQRDVVLAWLSSDDTIAHVPTLRDFVDHVGTGMGARCVMSAVRKESDPVAELTLTLLSEPQTHGVLARPELADEWAGDVLFGAKEALLHTNTDAHLGLRPFAEILDRLGPRLSRLRADDGRVALWAMQPLAVAAKEENHPLGTANDVWTVLRDSTIGIVRHGSVAEVFSVIFEVAHEGIVPALGPTKLSSLMEACAERIAIADFAAGPVGHHTWSEVAEYAAEVLGSMGSSAEATEAQKTWAYDTLQRWAARGLAKALENARRVRARD